MASKIQSKTFYVPIKPYKVNGIDDEFNELSVRSAYDDRRKHFYVSLQAGWRSDFGHGCIIMGDRNPLTSVQFIEVKDAPKNSQKMIDQMYANMELAAKAIAVYFDNRNFAALYSFVKGVALNGYNPAYAKQAEDYENNKQTSEPKSETTMAKKLQAADLIGKSIVIGENIATIRIESANGEQLSCKFCKEGQADAPMPLTVQAIEDKVAAGLWRIEGVTVEPDTSENVEEVDDVQPSPKVSEPKDDGILGQSQAAKPSSNADNSDSRIANATEPVSEKPKVRVVQPKGFAEKAASEREQSRAGSDSAEREQARPEGKVEPKAKPQTSNLKSQTSKYRFETYTREKNGHTKTLARIWGIDENHPAYQQATQLHASASFDKDKAGNKTYYLAFGARYVKAAEQLCKAMNAGKPIADLIAIIDKATEEREQKREEWKQKIAERNAQTEAKPKAETKGEKTYTRAEVEEKLRSAFGVLAETAGMDAKDFDPIIVATMAA